MRNRNAGIQQRTRPSDAWLYNILIHLNTHIYINRHTNTCTCNYQYINSFTLTYTRTYTFIYTHRIYYLFCEGSVRKKPFTDKHIAKAVGIGVGFVGLILVALCTYIGTPSLTFTTSTAQRSATENAKLITVGSTCSGIVNLQFSHLHSLWWT